MIDPYGHAASLRSESVSKNPSSTKDIDVRLQVKACLHELNEIAETLGDQGQKYKDCLRVKLYRTLPSVSIYSTKGLTLVGTFLHAKKAIEGPQFAISTSASFVEDAYTKEFDLIWQSPTSLRYLLCNQDGDKDVHHQLDITRGNDPFNDI
ncbi:MAG: hypothetical protein ACK41W_00080 [Cyanobacteriota bacterium]